jgi:hypothetical protein
MRRQRPNTMRFAQSGYSEREQGMIDPAIVDGIGFVAASLVFATFYMRSMIALRWVAIASNFAFIAYGYFENLPPVLLLHVLLLPINVCRLAQLRRGRTAAARTVHIPDCATYARTGPCELVRPMQVSA